MVSKFIECRLFPATPTHISNCPSAWVLNIHLESRLNACLSFHSLPQSMNRNSALLVSQGKKLSASLGSSFFYTYTTYT